MLKKKTIQKIKALQYQKESIYTLFYEQENNHPQTPLSWSPIIKLVTSNCS
ncbi:MAG: hypothetical protein ACOC1P_00675 [Minisyncoccales bacterium]